MSINCPSCTAEMLSSWNFCPHCGCAAKTGALQSTTHKEINSDRVLPTRFVDLIADYESLTNSKLNASIKEDFMNHAAVPNLSVIDRERRIKSGRRARRDLGNGKHSLDLQDWLDHVYDNPPHNSGNRVWITSRGDKYHDSRDCRGLRDGQNYARFFGKETYNPEFVELRRAAYVLGKTPCLFCKPPQFKKES